MSLLTRIFNRKPKKVYAVTKDNTFTKDQIISAIQGLEEGQVLDILSTCSTQAGYSSTLSAYIDKNNYPTYSKQVQVINMMYNNRTDYGSEILKAVIKTRVSFIGGEGLSVKAENKKTLDFITKFLSDNKLLEGSQLIANLITGEMEGKDLMQLAIGKDIDGKKMVKVRNWSWYVTPYDIQCNEKDTQEFTKSVISMDKKDKGNSKKQTILNKDKFVYVKLGGSPDRINLVPPLMANILTDIENFSRTKYDMRKNNHLFGRATPIFLVTDIKEAKSLQNAINSLDNVIGKSYAGTATQVFYLEPSGQAQAVLAKEMIDLLRIISTNTGIPIQFMSYPDLLSNRATAENMLEMVNAATTQERLIWEEAFTELVRKAMVMSMEGGVEGAVNDPDGFELKLNFATLALLKQIAEVWIPLVDMEFVSKESVMSRIPGINVNKELKLLEKEKEKRMENMPDILNMDKEGEDKKEENPKEEEKEGDK